jgi:hypothetical protein
MVKCWCFILPYNLQTAEGGSVNRCFQVRIFSKSGMRENREGAQTYLHGPWGYCMLYYTVGRKKKAAGFVDTKVNLLRLRSNAVLVVRNTMG